MKILIFGGSGLLGTDIKKVCADEFEVKALSSVDIDIVDLESVAAKIRAEAPDIVINSAAITDVDKCEENPDIAYRVNALGPKNIAIACRGTRIKLVQISTDYVFDGEKGEPYIEFDDVSPVNVYGKSKVAGEEFVKDIHNDYMIIRTAWIFGERRKHFVDYVVNGILKNEDIVAVKDMISSPTYSHDLAVKIKEMAAGGHTGIFHMANKGYCSRVEMVEEIMRIMKKTTKVQIMNQSQWKRPAKRPVFSALKNYHLGLLDSDNIPGWRDALKRYIRYKLDK